MTAAWAMGRFRSMARRWDRAERVDPDPLRWASGERLLLSDAGAGGLRVYATDRALYHGRPATGWTRRGWEEIDHAGWDPQRGVLVLTGLGPGGPWRCELPLPDGVPLALLARERIRWTTLLATVVHLDDDGGDARITARRQPGTGTLTWVVRLPPGVGRDDPRISSTVDAAIAELRALAGI